MNLNILKCEIARLAALYAQKIMWGLECEVELMGSQICTLINQVWMVENIDNCPIPPSLYNNILICINRLEAVSPASLCNNC